MTKTDSLIEIIKNRIQTGGPITFRDFMDMVLYYPGLGYYMTGRTRIGKAGDFYTSPYASETFGEFIGVFIARNWCKFGKKPFTIVEMGAEKGLLSVDIQNYLKKAEPELAKILEYIEVERGDRLPEVDLGCFLSNELVDAFPVHRIYVNKTGETKEIYVGLVDDKFSEIYNVVSTPEIEEYFNELDFELPKEFKTEVNLEAIRWIDRVATALKKGTVLTIDYGYLSRELYQPYRAEGTLMGYHQHIPVDDPYANIGGQDLTSHVNFSALIHWGRKAGLTKTYFNDQTHFLMEMGFEKKAINLRSEVETHTEYLEKYLNLKMLIMPGALGDSMNMLVQEKK